LFSNRYEVEPFLVGKKVELRFDPEDLSQIDVFLSGEWICPAVPFRIGRHVHPSVPQAPQPPAEPAGPGIDYLGLVRMAENKAQGVGEIAYVEVTLPGLPEREVAE
jgi:putative transposase